MDDVIISRRERMIRTFYLKKTDCHDLTGSSFERSLQVGLYSLQLSEHGPPRVYAILLHNNRRLRKKKRASMTQITE